MSEWKIIYQTAAITADSLTAGDTLIFGPGENKEWRIISVRQWVVTGSTTSAGVTPRLEVRDSGGEVYAAFVGPTLQTLGASDSGKYFTWAYGLEPDTAFILPDSSNWNTPIPKLVIPKNWSLAVMTISDGTADSLEAWVMAWQRPTL